MGDNRPQEQKDQSRARYLTALRLRVQGKTYREIGETLGVSVDRAIQLTARGSILVKGRAFQPWWDGRLNAFIAAMRAAYLTGQRISFMEDTDA